MKIRILATAALFVIAASIGTASAAPGSSIPGDGTYTVGGDIQPGIYHTSGPSGDIDCYWERDRDLSGAGNSIIANNISKGPQTVQISATDAAFQTNGCARWTLTAPIAPPVQPAPQPAPVQPAPAPTGSSGS